MSFEYAAYLAFVLFGTLALSRVFGVRLPTKRLALTLAAVAALFITWDVLAVAAGHWSFDARFITGVFVGNQPVEEIAFFFVVPLFYAVVWEIAKARTSETHKGGRRP